MSKSARVSALGEETGDLAIEDAVTAHSQLPLAEQEEFERQGLVAAARAIGKVAVLKHEVEGTPLPAGFLARYPKALESSTVTRSARATAFRPPPDGYPTSYSILSTSRIREQVEKYYCGPASFQSIEWNWDDDLQSQDHWASALGTTAAGTAITAMVRETNQNTGWDNDAHAGPYVTLDISGYTFAEWYSLNYRHYYNYRAPVILHPVLLKDYFPYLDDNGSGHFQVGRGYDWNGDDANLIGYFEPWNQQRFDPSEPFIARVQLRVAVKSYNANQAHPAHNIGV